MCQHTEAHATIDEMSQPEYGRPNMRDSGRRLGCACSRYCHLPTNHDAGRHERGTSLMSVRRRPTERSFPDLGNGAMVAPGSTAAV